MHRNVSAPPVIPKEGEEDIATDDFDDADNAENSLKHLNHLNLY